MLLPFFRKKQTGYPESGPLENSQRRIVRRELDTSGAKFSKPKVTSKPWGRKERLLILGLLTATILIALGGWMSTAGSLPSLKSFKLPQILVPSQTYIFEKER